MKNRFIILVSLVLLALAAPCASAQALRVFADKAFQPALKEIKPLFVQQTGFAVEISWGHSPALAEKIVATVGPVDAAISPAVGGIIPGYETAKHLNVRSMYVEREGGEFKLRRGFSVEPGEKIVMVEDIVTTGLSSRECIAAIQKAGGHVVAAACIVDRSGGKVDVGVPLIALASMEVPAYPADALPPELAALPVEDPGSRRLSK